MTAPTRTAPEPRPVVHPDGAPFCNLECPLCEERDGKLTHRCTSPGAVRLVDGGDLCLPAVRLLVANHAALVAAAEAYVAMVDTFTEALLGTDATDEPDFDPAEAALVALRAAVAAERAKGG